VAFIAYALHSLNPPCTTAAKDAVKMLIDNEWDISIEEVPWYLTNQFGPESVNQCVEDLQRVMTDDEACVKLRTILYWSALTPYLGRTTRCTQGAGSVVTYININRGDWVTAAVR
jgi:hypothetical protein